MLAAGLWSEAREEQGAYLNLVMYTLNAYLPMVFSFLATSPHYRPIHLKYAVDKGIHSFVEKPVATDRNR